ncbi:MAG: hypothetical protein AMXMBFR33_68310 [Candidatus Xenobia bacterium]
MTDTFCLAEIRYHVHLLDYVINGRSLLDRVREIEYPLWVADAKQRLGTHPDPDYTYDPPESTADSMAGHWEPRHRKYLLAPSRFLLGEVDFTDGEFEDAPQARGVPIYSGGSAAGSIDPFCCRIDVDDRTVRWSQFYCFHRPNWDYRLGPFIFERATYEKALRHPTASIDLGWLSKTGMLGKSSYADEGSTK